MIKTIIIEGVDQIFHLTRERSEICLYRVEIRTLHVTPQRIQTFTINQWMTDRNLQATQIGRNVYNKERLLGEETRRLYSAIDLLVTQGRM